MELELERPTAKKTEKANGSSNACNKLKHTNAGARRPRQVAVLCFLFFTEWRQGAQNKKAEARKEGVVKAVKL